MWSKLYAAQDPLCTTYPNNQCNLLCLNDNELIFIPRADKTGAWIWKYNIEKDSRIGYPVGIGYPPTWGELTTSLRKGDKNIIHENIKC